MITRRKLLSLAVTSGALMALPYRAGAAWVGSAGLLESNLIYLSPIKSDGELSQCQAEIWFAMLGSDVFVCTAANSWRARAPTMALDQARIWVGDLGNWRKANYQSLPSISATASMVSDESAWDKVLNQFAVKYSAEWSTWGPRFKKGLNDGSRTMLKYRLATNPEE